MHTHQSFGSVAIPAVSIMVEQLLPASFIVGTYHLEWSLLGVEELLGFCLTTHMLSHSLCTPLRTLLVNVSGTHVGSILNEELALSSGI